MANENKRIEDHVADDDEPTAELEILAPHHFTGADTERESDATTYGINKVAAATSDVDKSTPEPQSDLGTRGKTISRLQHDIEQLRAKWLGLEAEIGAREDIVNALSAEVANLEDQLALRDIQLGKQDDKNASLIAQLRKRDDTNTSLELRLAELEQQLTEQRSTDTERATEIDEARSETEALRGDLQTAREEIATLETEIQKRSEDQASLDRNRAELEQQLSERTNNLEEAESDLQRTKGHLDEAQGEIASLNSEIKQRVESYALIEQQSFELQQQFSEKQEALQKSDLELQDVRSSLEEARKEISSLNSTLQQRDEAYSSLQQQHADQQRETSAQSELRQQAETDLKETRSRLKAALDEIRSLGSTIEQRDEAYRNSEQRHAELDRQLSETLASLQATQAELKATNSELAKTREDSAAEVANAKKSNDARIKEIQGKLAGAEKYADTLRFKLQEFTDAQNQWSKERSRLKEEAEHLAERNQTLLQELEATGESGSRLQAALAQQQADHDKELQTLRLELTGAQDTATRTSELNGQLSDDLVEARESKVELEQLLREKDELAQERVDELEKQLRMLSKTSDELESKLETKSAAINALLAELARKTEQLESIGDMEEVIQDIDNRMSGRIDDRDKEATAQAEPMETTNVDRDRDRTTRVLIGNFGDRELRFPLFKKQLTIGRVEENDIQLKTSYISRRHAQIVTEGDITRVMDCNSKNGVFVNSKRVKDCALSNGDIVSIGNVKFRYEERPKRDV